MNRIALAYCRDQAELAAQLDRKLTRIGIPFEHISDAAGDTPGAFAEKLQQNTEPVLLIVTDNMLKSESCMTGLLAAVQAMAAKKLLVVAVADGRSGNEAVTTHFDRMVYALQYMNFWQNAWLDLSSTQMNATDPELKAELGPKLDAIRHIANETGELITQFRDLGYIEWRRLEADYFAEFFRLFGLSNWHEQYKQLAAYEAPQTQPAAEEPAQVLNTPTVTGFLTPTPIPPPSPEPELPEIDHLIEEFETEETFEVAPLNGQSHENQHVVPEEPEIHNPDNNSGYSDADIQQTIRDAWFWLEKGQLERGLELLSLALEQHPDNSSLQSALADARKKFSETTAQTPVVAPEPAPPVQVPAHNTPDPAFQSNECKSYDLMGDMAVEKGDYLFAKYCWDRVAEINPGFPGIYRKLGLMTSEHLRDYRETGILYLQKALLQQADDAEVLLAYADQIRQKGERSQAESHYLRAVALDPSLRTQERDEQFLPPVEAPAAPDQPELPELPAPPPVSRIQPKEILTVMITGAGSGIGLATAQIFAENGHRLIITGRRAERLSALKMRLEQDFSTPVLMLPFDVRERETVQATIDHLPEEWQNIDILINNAGGAKGLAPIHEGNIDHWETMIDANLKGLLYVTRAVSPGMVQRRRGHIINLCSVAGKEAYANGNVYCATKFAVDALTRSMRLDLHKYNIRVSQVCPGHVEETEFALTRFDGDAEKAKIYEDFQPLKASDVADTIYYIATRPPHVNIQDVLMFGTQQASATVVDRSGR